MLKHAKKDSILASKRVLHWLAWAHQFKELDRSPGWIVTEILKHQLCIEAITLCNRLWAFVSITNPSIKRVQFTQSREFSFLHALVCSDRHKDLWYDLSHFPMRQHAKKDSILEPNVLAHEKASASVTTQTGDLSSSLNWCTHTN